MRWLFVAAAVLLTGCVSAPVSVPLDPHASWPLLSPASLAQSRQVAQVLRGQYYDGHGNASFSLRTVISVDAQQLTVVGLTGMGMRVFTLEYNGQDLTEERAPQVPTTLQARQLLNDLQLVFWPLPELQQAWREAGGDVSEPYPATRRLQRAGKLLAEVHYAAEPWQGRVWLTHFDPMYSLFIESTPLDRDP